MTEQREGLERLYGQFLEKLGSAPADKQESVIKKVIKSLETAIKEIDRAQGTKQPKQPSRRSLVQIKTEMMTNAKALRLLRVYEGNSKLINLRDLAEGVDLQLKTLKFDRVLLEYYAKGRLEELHSKLMEVAENNPSKAEDGGHPQLRGELRALKTEQEIAARLQSVLTDRGIEALRDFARYLGVKVRAGKRLIRLSKSAPPNTVIASTAAHLWTEKESSRALEG